MMLKTPIELFPWSDSVPSVQGWVGLSQAGSIIYMGWVHQIIGDEMAKYSIGLGDG